MNICDRAYNNPPCECKKIADFLSLLNHNLLIIYASKIKSLSLLQNSMGFLLKLTEMVYHIQNWRY